VSDLILVLDDQEGVRQLLAQSLDGEDRSLRSEPVPDDLLGLIRELDPALLILDPTGVPRTVEDLVVSIREYRGDLPLILISSRPEIGDAVAAIRAGASAGWGMGRTSTRPPARR